MLFYVQSIQIKYVQTKNYSDIFIMLNMVVPINMSDMCHAKRFLLILIRHHTHMHAHPQYSRNWSKQLSPLNIMCVPAAKVQVRLRMRRLT